MKRTDQLKYMIRTTLFGFILATSALHADNGTAPMPVSSTSPDLQADFSKTALPILKQSCFACHGPQPQSTDGIKDPHLRKKAQKSIAKAQTQYQMATTFPFPNGDKPKDDLKDMDKALQKGWMPPREQKILNMGQPLSESDKKTLLDWTTRALKEMK